MISVVRFPRCFPGWVAFLAVFGFIHPAFGFGTSDLKLPPGYTISEYASDVPNARQMALTPAGILFVGSRRLGEVRAVVDIDADFKADKVTVVAKDLNMPTGLAFNNNSLFVAEVNRILRFDDIENQYETRPQANLVYGELPSETHHGWKFVAFGPDGKLYIPVGAPCNVCRVEDPFGTLMRLDLASGEVEVIARGIRNTVGFDWHPATGELWFSDNGRDWLGDDKPGCELNRITSTDQHFGFPYIHADGIEDPEFGPPSASTKVTMPAQTLAAHVAPLGIEFYSGDMFPSSSEGQTLFVAEHGSWNRSRKSGYRVMKAVINAAGEVVSYEPFITGWLKGQANWGRPVDFEQMSDGSLLISDDHAGRIYRVTYRAP